MKIDKIKSFFVGFERIFPRVALKQHILTGFRKRRRHAFM